MHRRVVVTGIGVVSSVGIGKEKFWKSLCDGRSGIKPITSIDTSLFKTKLGGEIQNLEPKKYIKGKGLKYLNRATIIGVIGGLLAFEDCGIKQDEFLNEECGVVVGTTTGHLSSVADSMKVITENPSYVSPMTGPNGGINIIASHLAIKTQSKAFNATIPNGSTSGLDAIIYGYDLIRNGHGKIAIAGGVEDLCFEHFLGMYNTNQMSRSVNGHEALSAPFDKRRNGFLCGEGSAFLILEDYEHATNRSAEIYAEVSGYSRAFNNSCSHASEIEVVSKVMNCAIKNSKLSVSDVSSIMANGNSSIDLDLVEGKAIQKVFGADNHEIKISSIKGALGECGSASGGLSCAAGIMAIMNKKMIPLLNYAEKDPNFNLNIVTEKNDVLTKNEHMLINSFGSMTNKSALILCTIQKESKNECSSFCRTKKAQW